jgi:hypothetical protein
MTQESGAYSTCNTYFDCVKVAIICQVTDFIKRGLIKKTFLEFAQEMNKMTMSEYVHFNDDEVFPISTYGSYFPAVVANPSKYILA